MERGLADAADNTIFDDFEKWEDETFWPPVKATFGSQDEAASVDAPALDAEISPSLRAFHLTRGVTETVVLKNELISSDPSSPKKTH